MCSPKKTKKLSENKKWKCNRNETIITTLNKKMRSPPNGTFCHSDLEASNNDFLQVLSLSLSIRSSSWIYIIIITITILIIHFNSTMFRHLLVVSLTHPHPALPPATHRGWPCGGAPATRRQRARGGRLHLHHHRGHGVRRGHRQRPIQWVWRQEENEGNC